MPQFFASCATSLEYLLVDELKSLGAKNVKEGLSLVNFDADWPTVYDALLWSRIASRILYPIAKFEAKDEQTLYDQVSIVDWSQHIGSGSSFVVHSQSFRSDLQHTKFISQRIKDAIVDHFTDMDEQRPDVEFEHPDVVIQCRIRQNQVILSIDLAGAGLHRRGYRLQGASAPIKENLAAALLTRAGWLARCQQENGNAKTLYDPMCGSGTFLIEAAMMALNIAPGLNRGYLGLFGWSQFDSPLWDERQARAEKLANESKGREDLFIQGSDINPKAITSAQNNVAQAKLSQVIKLYIAGLDQVNQTTLPTSGLVIVNPPYSERLGEFDEVKELYGELGELLKTTFTEWHASVLSPNKMFGHNLGIRAKKIYKFNNGSIACELLNFKLEQENFIQAKQKNQVDKNFREKLSDSAVQLCNRIEKNRAKLKKYLTQNNITCYRVYDSDLPEYNAAIDVYDNRLHVQEYRAPKSVDDKVALRRIKEIQRVAAGIFEITLADVFIKQRRQQKGDWQYESKGERHAGELANANYFHVSESNRKFKVNLRDYLDTGLFVDHRKTRELVGSLCRGKRLLNLFCYTGAFSVYAATQGALKTVNVDLSNTYLNWAKDNFEANKISKIDHQFVRDDSLTWLTEAVARKDLYDVIFLDPPTFSNSKKMEKHFDVQVDHLELIECATKLLDDKGILIFSNNYSQFKMAYQSTAQFSVKEITKQTTSPDFFRKPLHRCWKIEKN